MANKRRRRVLRWLILQLMAIADEYAGVKGFPFSGRLQTVLDIWIAWIALLTNFYKTVRLSILNQVSIGHLQPTKYICKLEKDQKDVHVCKRSLPQNCAGQIDKREKKLCVGISSHQFASYPCFKKRKICRKP